MPLPTATFGWRLPSIGQTSWYQEFRNLVSSMETAIRSVQSISGPRAFTVLSVFPTTSLQLTFNASGEQAGSSAWVTLSCAPFGVWAGTFSVRSGYGVLMSIAHRYLWSHDPRSTPSTCFFRGIVNPGSVELCGANSVWRGKFANGLTSPFAPPQRQFATFSAAAGVYQVTFFVKGVSGQSGHTAQYLMGQPHAFTVVGRDVRG